MKKISYLCMLLLFTIFIPRVYAFTYDMDVSVGTTSVKIGAEKEITVSLKNVQGTSDGIISCSLNIELDKSIILNTSVRTLNNWSMTYGNFYLFDTGSPVFNDTKIFIVPVKVNDDGNIKLTDIKCSDGNTIEEIDDKNINFTILNNTTENNNVTNNTESNNDNSNNNDQGNDVETEKNSNCDLSNIVLSEGTIEFDSAVTEYSVKVSDFESLKITPVLASETSQYIIDPILSQDGNNSVVITVQAENGNTKVYTLYVEEISNEEPEEKNNYVPIFIGIICVLVLINIIRIVTKNKK